MSRGKFIVLEGLDGSGKGTQIEKLVCKLKDSGRRVYQTAEPTQSSIGGLLRDALSGQMKRDAYELSALFLADRIFHNVNPVSGIRKYIDEGIDVVCDRYYYSSFAYQGTDADLEWVMRMNLDCKEIIRPDLCIFLDIDPKLCENRLRQGRFSREIYENTGMQERIRQRFYDVFSLLDSRENIRIVDASGTVEEVAAGITDIVFELF